MHGKLKASEKQKIIKNFEQKIIKILVSTIVVEVGIDIQGATIIVIENAERFGLAQMHQLRGRVGRNNKESFCLLIHDNKLSDISKQRLKILKSNNNGFELAEQDLKLRGSGHILRTTQSGFDSFNFFNFQEHLELMQPIAQLAKQIIEQDPKLNNPQNECLKILIEIFYDVTLELLIQAG